MFKLITFGVLAYLAYKVFFDRPKQISSKKEAENDQIIDVDYEEID